MQWLAWPAWLWPGVSGTVGQTTLTVAQLAKHSHSYRSNIQTGHVTDDGTALEYPEEFNTGTTGDSQPHTHTLSGASGEANNLPPYYALAYIMRTS